METDNFHCDPDTLALMGDVCDCAWREIQEYTFFPSADDARTFRDELAERVLAAVSNGIRDPRKLRSIALASIDR